MMMLSSFGSIYGTLIFFSLMFAPLVPLAFLVTSFSHAVMTSADMPEFRQRLVVPLAGILVMGVALLSSLGLQRYLDLDKDITSVPGVSFNASPKELAALNSEPAIFRFDDVFSDTDVFPLEEGKLPYNEDNVTAVRAYLNENGNTTALKGTIYNYLIYYRMRELDARGATALYREAFSATGEEMYAIFMIQRLNAGTAVEENLALLNEFAGDPEYVINGKCASMVGKIYIKFGETGSALYWYDKSIHTEDGDSVEPVVPLKDAPFNHGVLSGRVAIYGRPVAGVRTGVIKKGSADYLAKGHTDDNQTVSPKMGLLSLADGTVTGPDGRFEFTGLGEQEYVLLLSLEDVPGKRYVVKRSPGVVGISEGNPTVDAGTIELALEDAEAGSR